MNGNKKSQTDDQYKPLYYRAMIDGNLLLLKTILILNSGALASILVAISRSDDSGFAQVVIAAAYKFWWGLLAAIISLMTFKPLEEDFDDLKKHWDKHKPMIIFSAFLVLFSCGIFLYGIRIILAGLTTLWPEAVSVDG
ncbi:MAG: hypothetical protein OXF88_22390 [Rhodobacteraceae bacterium]|nr:hypothetical protein [Paracoccaceae bacterium]